MPTYEDQLFPCCARYYTGADSNSIGTSLRTRSRLGVFLVWFLFSSLHGVNAQTSKPEILSPRLAALQQGITKDRSGALSLFWEEVAGHAPLIEPYPADNRLVLLTYIWRGSQSSSVGVMGDVPIDSSYGLQRLEDTDVWFRTERIPKDARFGYLLCDNLKGCAKDPLNPKWWNAIGRSVVELPDAPSEPWITVNSAVPQGRLTMQKLDSKILGEERPIAVYTPPGFAKGNGPYNLLIVFDGQGYGIDKNSPIPTPTILDNLISHVEISPTVAILVSNIDQQHRNRDLACYTPFSDFLAKELVPWAASSYQAGAEPSRTVVAGSSLGGLAAGCAGFRHPEVFGNVLSQSGTYAYSPDSAVGENSYFLSESNWLAQEISLRGRVPLRFYLSIGRLEGGAASSGLLENRRLRDVLTASGVQVTYHEYTGSHDALTWRDSIADGLIVLLGSQRFENLR